MTEINLTLTLGKVSKIENNNIPANVKVLKLELSYPTAVGDTINKFYEKVPPTQDLKEVNIVFFDGAENEIYNELLDNNGENRFIGLSWEKEKVNFLIPGKEESKEDDTKPKINFLSVSKEMEIELKPQFAGIVKITYTGPSKKPNQDKDNQSPRISELEKEIAFLQSRIRELENKKTQVPANSADYRRYNQQIQQIKSELKEKERQEKQLNGGEFPWKPIFIIGGGTVLILVIIFLIKKNFKK